MDYDETVLARLESVADRLERHLDYPEVLVSCVEAARLLRKSPTTISTMLREGRLKKVTIGSSTGIRLSEIREQAAEMR